MKHLYTYPVIYYISVQLIIHGQLVRSKSDRLTGTFVVLVDIRIVKLRSRSRSGQCKVRVGFRPELGLNLSYTLLLVFTKTTILQDKSDGPSKVKAG